MVFGSAGLDHASEFSAMATVSRPPCKAASRPLAWSLSVRAADGTFGPPDAALAVVKSRCDDTGMRCFPGPNVENGSSWPL